MADPAQPAAPSRCAACGFENPTATLYCQNCGGKLGIAPPSYLTSAPLRRKPPPRRRRPQEGPASSARNARPRPPPCRIPVSPASVAGGGHRRRSHLPAPANVPPAEASLDADTIGTIRASLAEVAKHHSNVNAPWSRLNAYLASVLASGNSVGIASFTRAFLQPRPGGFDLVVQKSIAGLPLYSSVYYQPVVRGGRLGLEPAGATLGRLPLPKFLAPAIAGLGGDLSVPLFQEFNLLRQARTVRLTPEGVLVDFGPARP